MHQMKKRNEWYFETKVHAGVDAGGGYVHTITGTSANMHDVTKDINLLREDLYKNLTNWEDAESKVN